MDLVHFQNVASVRFGWVLCVCVCQQVNQSMRHCTTEKSNHYTLGWWWRRRRQWLNKKPYALRCFCCWRHINFSFNKSFPIEFRTRWFLFISFIRSHSQLGCVCVCHVVCVCGVLAFYLDWKRPEWKKQRHKWNKKTQLLVGLFFRSAQHENCSLHPQPLHFVGPKHGETIQANSNLKSIYSKLYACVCLHCGCPAASTTNTFN